MALSTSNSANVRPQAKTQAQLQKKTEHSHRLASAQQLQGAAVSTAANKKSAKRQKTGPIGEQQGLSKRVVKDPIDAEDHKDGEGKAKGRVDWAEKRQRRKEKKQQKIERWRELRERKKKVQKQSAAGSDNTDTAAAAAAPDNTSAALKATPKRPREAVGDTSRSKNSSPRGSKPTPSVDEAVASRKGSVNGVTKKHHSVVSAVEAKKGESADSSAEQPRKKKKTFPQVEFLSLSLSCVSHFFISLSACLHHLSLLGYVLARCTL